MSRKVVEIISKDKRYRKEPYPSRPAYDTRLRVYLTGQHIIPGVLDRGDFLTTEEMLDSSKISTAKLKKFPASAVINPTEVLMINHRRKLNITPLEGKSSDSKYPGDFEVPADKAIYEYLLEREYVARSEDEYVPGIHFFYISDKEVAAEKRLSKKEKRYAAEKYIRESVKISEYRQFALLLNYKIKGFNLIVDGVSETILKDSLLDAAEKYPEVVLSLDSKKNNMVQKELFVLMLIDQKILEIKSGAYYDGSKFLGSSIPAVIATLEKEESLMAKFAGLLKL